MAGISVAASQEDSVHARKTSAMKSNPTTKPHSEVSTANGNHAAVITSTSGSTAPSYSAPFVNPGEVNGSTMAGAYSQGVGSQNGHTTGHGLIPLIQGAPGEAAPGIYYAPGNGYVPHFYYDYSAGMSVMGGDPSDPQHQHQGYAYPQQAAFLPYTPGSPQIPLTGQIYAPHTYPYQGQMYSPQPQQPQDGKSGDSQSSSSSVDSSSRNGVSLGNNQASQAGSVVTNPGTSHLMGYTSRGAYSPQLLVPGTGSGRGRGGVEGRTGGRIWNGNFGHGASNGIKDKAGRGRGGSGPLSAGAANYYSNGFQDAANEQNRGPRTMRVKNRVNGTVNGSTVGSERSESQQGESSAVLVGDSTVDASQYNKTDLKVDYDAAKFFVIKSYSEDDVHKSIKYNVWASTPNGNKRLDAAFREAAVRAKSFPGGCPVYLFFSVNASGQFCGVAEMLSEVDFSTSLDFWQQDKWNGQFKVKWHIVKDVPNAQFRHILVATNENKPVTNSRDTQEVVLEQGLEMLRIFKNFSARTSLLDDFSFYESRQKAMQERRTRQQQQQQGLQYQRKPFNHNQRQNLFNVGQLQQNGIRASEAFDHLPKELSLINGGTASPPGIISGLTTSAGTTISTQPPVSEVDVTASKENVATSVKALSISLVELKVGDSSK